MRSHFFRAVSGVARSGSVCVDARRVVEPWAPIVQRLSSLSQFRCFCCSSKAHSSVSTVEQSGNADKRSINLMTAVNEALAYALEDGRTLVFGEDVAFGGVFRCTGNLQSRFGASRVFNTPTSELGIVGFGAGAAAYGMRPVAEIQFADYIFPAFDQLVNEVAKYRYRSGGDFNCGGLTVRMPYGAVGHGGHYHSQSPEGYFTHCPGLKVVVPSCPSDTYNLLRAAIETPDPVLFFEPKQLYRMAVEEVDLGAPVDVTEIGKAKVVVPGTDLTIVAWGRQVGEVKQAAELLQSKHGIVAEVIDLRTLAPWDSATVEASVNKTGRVMVTHEAPITSGFGAEIIAHISKECFLSLEVPPERVCGYDTPFPCVYEPLYLPTPSKIVDAAVRMMKY